MHTLRHSHASAALEAGIGLKTVSELLGHSSIAITGDVYAHLSAAAAHKAVDTSRSRIAEYCDCGVSSSLILMSTDDFGAAGLAHLPR